MTEANLDTQPTEPTYDRTTQDVGNVLGLEHVNLTVPDRDLAERFYVTGLGFTRDPYMDLGLYGITWVNLGSQQMHLIHTPQAQRFRGRIGLVVPDLDAVTRRLDRLRDRVPLVSESLVAHTMVDDRLVVTGPWGNTFVVHGPDELEGWAIGMPYLEIDVAPGRAAGIADFYRDILGAPVTVGANGNGITQAVVAVGLHQEIRFMETADPIADYDGHHIAVYLANFSGPYRQLQERGLISRETDQSEYRFTDIVDPATGEVGTVLEHEVRSMHHPMFGRALINRNADQGLGQRYHKGHDTVPGLHQGGVG